MARVKTQSDVAKDIGCSPKAVSDWERGERAPEPAMLQPLANSLLVRPLMFSKPVPDYGPSPIFFRSFANAAVKARKREKARTRWLQHISLELQHHLDFPVVDIPDLVGDRHFSTLTEKDLEDAAGALRRHWGCGDGPISDILLLLENAGIVVGTDLIKSNAIDGQSAWMLHDNRPYILLAKDKENAFRRAMDCAHELAHLILHRGVEEAELEEHLSVIEHQAKYFAGALLLPYKSFSQEIRSLSLDGFLELKARWGVSIGAMIMRAQQTDIISETMAARMWRYRSARGWHTKEPLDLPEETEVPQPRLLRRSIELLVDSKIRAKSDLLDYDFCLPGSDIEMLSALPEGYFTEMPENVVRLEPMLRSGKDKESGEIVPFRRPQ